MTRNVFAAGRSGLLSKSAIAAIGLIALMGCTTTAASADASATTSANTGATTEDQISNGSGGTQNAALLQHMGISDTSYSSQNGDHGGSNFRRHHHN